jgi:hypothetical protein
MFTLRFTLQSTQNCKRWIVMEVHFPPSLSEESFCVFRAANDARLIADDFPKTKAIRTRFTDFFHFLIFFLLDDPLHSIAIFLFTYRG